MTMVGMGVGVQWPSFWVGYSMWGLQHSGSAQDQDLLHKFHNLNSLMINFEFKIWDNIQLSITNVMVNAI